MVEFNQFFDDWLLALNIWMVKTIEAQSRQYTGRLVSALEVTWFK